MNARPSSTRKSRVAEGSRGVYDASMGTDPRLAVVAAIRDAGIAIDEPERIVADGKLTRFHVEGDRHGSRNGWAVLFDDAAGVAASFGHWKSGASGTWSMGRGILTEAERARLREATAKAMRQREAERARAAEQAAARAVQLWSQAAQPDPAHPYLVRKKIKAYGIRQLNDKLVIPLRDADGKLWSIEYIHRDGTKLFLSGGRKRGCYFSIGHVDPEHGELCIAEGFATAASIHESTGKPVAVAFDAGNLDSVARTLRAKFPGAVITICADNDASTPGNPGLTKATAAARAVGGYVAIPPAPYNDFNDAAVAEAVE